MSAVGKLRDRFPRGPDTRPLRALAASGQLGYGIPEPALKSGLARNPDFIGCDMGSIDPGPHYLGSGQIATSDIMTRRDLGLVLRGARALDVPLLLGTAGCAGARPHLDRTLEIIRSIAAEENLHFRLAVISADIPGDTVKAARQENRLRPLGKMAAPSDEEIDGSTHLVAQMGTEAFRRALDTEADVIIAGRACDTAIFTAVPEMLGFPLGPATHMAKIIECTSICCTPGGRDAMLGILEGDTFLIESMNPEIEEQVEKNLPAMRDLATTVLRHLTMADLERPNIMDTVRNQLKQGFDQVLQPPMVDEIYFTQFVVQ